MSSKYIKIPESLENLIPIKLHVRIPKIIHQTYITLDKLPIIWKNTPNSWKENHPEWKYMFWSDEDCRKLVAEHFPSFLYVYDGYEYAIQRADAVRYIILYIYGGLYADCDIQSIKPFDDLFYEYNDLYLIRTSNNNFVTNCLMASNPKINFWNDVINEMEYRYNNQSLLWIGKHFKVMCTTGPIMLDHVYKKINPSSVKFLPREHIIPTCCSICVEKPCSNIGGYTKLLEGSSWVGLDTILYNSIMCNYQKFLLFLSVVFIVYNVYVFYTYRPINNVIKN